MKKPYIWLTFLVIVVVFITSETTGGLGGKGNEATLTIIVGIAAAAYIRIVLTKAILEPKNIKLGSETLPPPKDISSILVNGSAISIERKNLLLKAIVRAQRATRSGKVIQEIPFQLADHWGGIWELLAYKEADGTRGFSINRVFYSGRNAQIVAECVGLTD